MPQDINISFIGTDNKFQLTGIGDIKGTQGDNARFVYWDITDTNNFETKLYIKSLSNGKAGIIVRNSSLNEINQGGKPCYFLYIDKEYSSLKLDIRESENTQLINYYTLNNITFPLWLSLKKINNTLVISYSKESESTTSINWTLLFTLSNVNFNNYQRGFILASKSNNSTNNAIISNWRDFTSTTNDFYVSSKTNKTKLLQYLTTGNILNINHFGTVPQRTYLDNNNYIRPNWAVYWDLSHISFTASNRKAWELGLAGLVYGGEVDMDTSKDGIDYKNSDYYTFVSSIPYQNRCHNQYNAVWGTEPWATGTLEQIYDIGNEVGQSNMLGGGDNISNKTKREVVMADVENSKENGSIEHRVFSIGAGNKTLGYFISLYNGVFLTFGYTIELDTGTKRRYNYPDNNGNYPSINNLNEDWNLNTTTTLLSRGIDNKKLTDYPNILPCNEYSLYNEMVAEQGTHYQLDYSGNYVVVNKFGNTKTVMNPFCGLGYCIEIQAWYCRYKLNNKRNVFMPKMLADKGSAVGRNEFSKNYDGTLKPDLILEHSNRQIGRKYSFLFTLLGFVNGVDLEIWDRAVSNNSGMIDTYSGILGVIQMLDNLGAISIYNNLIPEYWNTEYSLDEGVTWLKTKAIDWDESTSTVLPVRITKSSNSVLLTAFRPEGVEPLSFIARTEVNNVMKYFHVSSNNWETTDYNYATTPLGNLPNQAKHYYCQMFNF